MHQEWCAAGYDPDAFWHQTPRSFQSAMQGAIERRRRDANNDVAVAHTTASFTRAKRLEALPHYLRRPAHADRRPMLDRLKAIAARTAR